METYMRRGGVDGNQQTFSNLVKDDRHDEEVQQEAL